jgi:hypothetical protein
VSNPGTEWVKPETERVKSETERVTQDDPLDGLTLDGLTPDGETPSDEERSLSRDGGTSPGVGSDAPTPFDPVAQRLYADADMDRECPNCHAEAHEWCQREDGSLKRMPCLVRSRRGGLRDASIQAGGIA